MATSSDEGDDDPADDDASTELEQTTGRQYRTMAIGADDIVIYDTECIDAWVQSSTTVDLSDMM